MTSTSEANRNVLVVEPNTGVASALCSALRRRGHRVSAAGSVAEALELPAPEVLISEIALPDGTGFDLVARLRADRPDTAAVLLSALPRFEDCRRALHAGIHDVVPKPFRLDELLGIVEAARTQSGPRSEIASHATDAPTSFERRYACAPETVRRAARDLAAFALASGVNPATRARLATASAEILDNAVRHANATPESTIAIHLTSDGHDLSLRIEDEGRGFDAVAGWIDSAPSLVSETDASVLRRVPPGLARAASLAEDLRVESDGRGTRVHMRFSAPPSAFDEDAGDLSDLDFLVPTETKGLLAAVISGEPAGFTNLPPALAIAIGRLLSGPSPSQVAQAALWS